MQPVVSLRAARWAARYRATSCHTAGWDRRSAEEHFNQFAPMFEIGDPVEFVASEAHRLNRRYPKILVVPMIYRVEDNQVYLVQEDDGMMG